MVKIVNFKVNFVLIKVQINLLKYSLVYAVLWTCIIFILCCTPGKYIPTSNWLELLSFDKLVHASIFFILTTIWFIFIKSKNIFSFSNQLLIILSCIAYGALLEIMQATIFSQRSGDWFDFIANSLGCLISWGGIKFIFQKLNYLGS